MTEQGGAPTIPNPSAAVAPIRWGVLGCASTARKRFLPGMLRSQLARPWAIASRSSDRAQEFRELFGFEKSYSNYEAVLQDPFVDAVYIPLPVALHAEWVVRAIEAGKHVLCEKPLASSPHELQAILAAAASQPNLRVMEGFMYRFHPRWAYVRNLLSGGSLGKALGLDLRFCFRNTDPQNIRNIADMGGGALNDVGCYLVSASQYLLGPVPEVLSAVATRETVGGPDTTMAAFMAVGACPVSMFASLRGQRQQTIVIHCEFGSVHLGQAFDIAPTEPSTVCISRDAGQECIDFPPYDQFRSMIDQFCLSIIGDDPVPVPLPESLAVSETIEAIRRHSLVRTAGGTKLPKAG